MALLIDADILAYEAVSSAQQEVEFEPDVWQVYCDLNEARRLFDKSVDRLMEETSQGSYLLCFSDPTRANFRKQLNPDQYKANRSSRKPVGYWPFVHKVIERKNVKHLPRLEADDVIGILATSEKGHVIWSKDKDLKTIPGTHLMDGDEKVLSEHDADYFFYTQVLTGDQVDNYPGCPGIGAVKAEKILTGTAPPWGTHEETWAAIVQTYEAAGLTEADALLQARMAFILRHPHFNHKTGKIRLWKPPARPE